MSASEGRKINGGRQIPRRLGECFRSGPGGEKQNRSCTHLLGASCHLKLSNRPLVLAETSVVYGSGNVATGPFFDRYRNSSRRDNWTALFYRPWHGRRHRRNVHIGDDVTLFQGVTLGGTGKEKGKRHPTIGNDVMIFCGARVLGSIKVGDHSKIGAGSVVLHDVPPNSTVVGVPGRVVRQNGYRVHHRDLDQTHLPDPVADKMNKLEKEINELSNKKNELMRVKS